MTCDNIQQTHNLIEISDGDSAMRVICNQCWNQITIRKDPFKGVPEMRQYAKVFKRDVLQGNDPLFYKYYNKFLRQ